jgi:hypothetical protein
MLSYEGVVKRPFRCSAFSIQHSAFRKWVGRYLPGGPKPGKFRGVLLTGVRVAVLAAPMGTMSSVAVLAGEPTAPAIPGGRWGATGVRPVMEDIRGLDARDTLPPPRVSRGEEK